jgi:hypothetical protein
MTSASQGLAKALGRSASGDTIALAEMSAEDILANLSDEQRAELGASLTPPDANAGAMPPKKDGCSEDGDEDDAGGDGDVEEKPGMSASDDRIKAVAAAVATDDACKGKAAMALELLADDEFAGLSAEGIIKMLGKTSIDGADAAAADPEAAARADMKAALQSQQNSNIDAGGGSGAQPAAKASGDVWDKAIARVFPK